MKMTLVIMMLLLSIFASESLSQVFVRGYYRQDGTFVQPHYRTFPNATTLDNWSTKGNVNPYTGKEGTKDPSPRDNSTTQYYSIPLVPTQSERNNTKEVRIETREDNSYIRTTKQRQNTKSSQHRRIIIYE